MAVHALRRSRAEGRSLPLGAKQRDRTVRLHDGRRLIPLCLVPLWDVELAAAEVRRNAERGVRGLAFSEGPDQLGLPSIYDLEHWDPLFAACNDTGTTICMHVGSSSKPVLRPHR